MKRLILITIILASKVFADGAKESREAPCTVQERQEREDAYNDFKDRHKLSDED